MVFTAEEIQLLLTLLNRARDEAITVIQMVPQVRPQAEEQLYQVIGLARKLREGAQAEQK